jgi:hypothetical protein
VVGQSLQVAIGTTVARLACLSLFAIALAGGCGGGAGNSPVALAAFQRRALLAISQVTNAGTGYRGHAVLHLRMGMRAKGKAAAAGAVTLSRLRPPGSARSLNDRIVAVLWKLRRDFARAGRLSVAAALGTDAADVQRLVSLRSAVSAVPPY